MRNYVGAYADAILNPQRAGDMFPRHSTVDAHAVNILPYNFFKVRLSVNFVFPSTSASYRPYAFDVTRHHFGGKQRSVLHGLDFARACSRL